MRRSSRKDGGRASRTAMALFLALALLSGAVGGQPTASEPGASEPAVQEAIARIQRECLRAYPDKLLAEMASGAQEIPGEVEENPKAQMRFLDTGLTADKGLFYPSLLEDLLPTFERYLDPGTRFLDLGSGDGRVVFLAAVLGAEATGIEYDEALVKVSRRALRALHDVVEPRRARFVRGDFFASSWSGYEVVFYFDRSSFEQARVREKMARELDPGARLVVSYETIPFPGLEFEAEFPNIKIYRQPSAE